MRAIKLVVVALLVLIVLLGVAVGVFVATFDPNSYRDLLGSRVEAATGRRLTISGDLTLAVWPNIALRADGVSLSNASGFAAEPMLRMQALEATVQLRPLLQKEVRIDGVVLYSPQLSLEQRTGAPQANNWADLQTRFDAPADSTASTQIQLQSVEIVNGSLNYRAESGQHKLSALNAQIDIAADTALDISATGSWQSDEQATLAPFEFHSRIAAADTGLSLTGAKLSASNLPAGMPQQVDVQTQQILSAESGVLISGLAGRTILDGVPMEWSFPQLQLAKDLSSATAEAVDLTLANSRFTLDLRARNLFTTPALSGKLITRDADLQALTEAFSVSLPAEFRLQQPGTLNLTADFAADASSGLKVSDLSAALEQLNLQVNADIVVAPDGNARGNLQIGEVDLRALSTKLPALLPPDTFVGGGAPAMLQSLTSKFVWHAGAAGQPGRLEFDDAQVVGLGLTGEFAGRSVGDRLSMSAKLQTFNPGAFLTYFGAPLKTANPAALSTASGSATLTQNPANTRLDKLQIRLDKSNVTGWLNQSTDELTFDLSTDELDASDYLPPDEEPVEPRATLREVDANQALLGEMTLPTELLHAYRLGGTLQVADLRFFDLQLKQTQAKLALGVGVAQAKDISAQLYGGSLSGDFRVTQDEPDKPPTLAVNANLQAIALDQLLLALADTANFSGTGAVEVSLRGTGNTLLEATQDSTGRLSLALSEGEFTGVDLGHRLCELYNQLRSLPQPPASETNTTRFERFSATASIVNGEATTTDLSASNNYLQLTGTGRARLARQSINYDLDVQLTGPIEHPNCESLTPYIGSRIPVKLSGTFANPIVRPDFGKLVKREIRRRVEEKITEKLLDLLGGNKDPEPEPQNNP